MVVSGGWDNTIQIYDTRYRGPVRTIYGPHICGDCIEIRSDGHTMVTGSYRTEDCIEVYDLRMYKRSRTIPWEGSGNQEDLMYDDDGEGEPYTDNEEQKSRPGSVFGVRADNLQRRDDDEVSQTTTTTKSSRKAIRQEKRDAAPYLYTCGFNAKQDLLYAGGAGKNEMRVYDWESGNIVGMVSNLPTTIMSGAMAKSSNLFSFGCADSKVRIFNIEAHSNGRPF